MQVLQTLSILIQNMHSKEALFYMFSNNHINDIVRLRLDFEDEEVLGYYINLLKAISMKVWCSSGTSCCSRLSPNNDHIRSVSQSGWSKMQYASYCCQHCMLPGKGRPSC